MGNIYASTLMSFDDDDEQNIKRHVVYGKCLGESNSLYGNYTKTH